MPSLVIRSKTVLASPDPNCTDVRDEYMFGPALLIAPVTDQGATSRSVYLPAGADWYNFWTNERVKPRFK